MRPCNNYKCPIYLHHLHKVLRKQATSPAAYTSCRHYSRYLPYLKILLNLLHVGMCVHNMITFLQFYFFPCLCEVGQLQESNFTHSCVSSLKFLSIKFGTLIGNYYFNEKVLKIIYLYILGWLNYKTKNRTRYSDFMKFGIRW